MRTIRIAILMLVVMTALTGVLYPLAVMGIGRLAFRSAAEGSLIQRDGRVIGSHLVGQSFTAPGDFWGRPSALSIPYDASSSSGSNWGPLAPQLVEASQARLDALRAADSTAGTPVPVDLITASGSGLDPHISPAAAEYQVPRVARARGRSEAAVRDLVARHTEPRFLGLFGEPVVHVLELNLALDSLEEQTR